MLGVQPNSTVRGNVVHDSAPYFLYGHGVYLDEGASGITIEQNWVHNTYAASLLQHYGLNNTVRSNVWAFATGKCTMVSTSSWWMALRATTAQAISGIVRTDSSRAASASAATSWSVERTTTTSGTSRPKDFATSLAPETSTSILRVLRYRPPSPRLTGRSAHRTPAACTASTRTPPSQTGSRVGTNLAPCWPTRSS